MTVATRVAGWGTDSDGRLVTWTVSEGRKGRRWREVVARDDALGHALLLETDPDGRFSHLELARANGLWTFHPEGDGTLHGNHVDRSEAGIRHIEGWRFAPEDVLIVAGSTLSLAAIAYRWTASVVAGGRVVADAVVIAADGTLRREEAVGIGRQSPTRWRIGEAPPIEIDEAGLPLLAGGQRRPLEVG